MKSWRQHRRCRAPQFGTALAFAKNSEQAQATDGCRSRLLLPKEIPIHRRRVPPQKSHHFGYFTTGQRQIIFRRIQLPRQAQPNLAPEG